MNKFVKNIILFLLPVLFFFLGMECYIRSVDSSFVRKRNYLFNRLDSVELLAFGSSHMQNAFHALSVDSNYVNLAFGHQDYQLDSALYFSLVTKLPNLKIILLEMDYHSAEVRVDNKYFRLPWYYFYYGIELYELSILDKSSIYLSEPTYFNKILANNLFIDSNYHMNQQGFVDLSSGTLFDDYSYDSLFIIGSSQERLKGVHDKSSVFDFDYSTAKLRSIVNHAINNNIKVVLVKTPLFQSYKSKYLDDKLKRRDLSIGNFIDNYDGVSLFDLENSNKFNIYDFSDDHHLNSQGSNKFSDSLSVFLKNFSSGTLKEEL